MKPLNEILEVQEKTEKVLLLKVKEGAQLDLIANGFHGDEKLFRLMTSREGYRSKKSYTAFHGENLEPGLVFSWSVNCALLVGEELTTQRDLIVDVAKNYFDFDINEELSRRSK